MKRNLAVAGAAAAASVSACYSVWLWVSNYAGDNFHNDFTFYYAAARLGLAHGWSHLYDLRLQQEQLDAIGSHITVAQLARYVSPPPLAWLVTPLTLVPYQVAYWMWSAVLVAALVLAWQLAAPGSGRARVILLVAAFGWLPIVYGLQLGQPVLLVAAGVAACYALLKRGRDVEAGAVLGVLVVKPQLARVCVVCRRARCDHSCIIGGARPVGRHRLRGPAQPREHGRGEPGADDCGLDSQPPGRARGRGPDRRVDRWRRLQPAPAWACGGSVRRADRRPGGKPIRPLRRPRDAGPRVPAVPARGARPLGDRLHDRAVHRRRRLPRLAGGTGAGRRAYRPAAAVNPGAGTSPRLHRAGRRRTQA